MIKVETLEPGNATRYNVVVEETEDGGLLIANFWGAKGNAMLLDDVFVPSAGYMAEKMGMNPADLYPIIALLGEKGYDITGRIPEEYNDKGVWVGSKNNTGEEQ